MTFTKTISIPDGMQENTRDAGKKKDKRQMATEAAAVNGQNTGPMLRYLFHVT